MRRWEGLRARGTRWAAAVGIGACALVPVVWLQDTQAQPLARPAGHRQSACHVPRLAGASLSTARKRLARAGCRVLVKELPNRQGVQGGPSGPEPDQIVARQSPRAGGRGDVVTVWVKPLCFQSADPGPPAGEPLVSAGPTELISGLFLDGGPLSRAPRCRQGQPAAGTIVVTDSVTGAAVASRAVADGRLAEIALAPGTYSVRGTFVNATVNGQPIATLPITVTIPAGKTVRQDVSASIP